MSKMKVAVIVDDDSIRSWQLESILEASDLIDVSLLLSCRNSPTRKIGLNNFCYYIFAYMFARCSERFSVPLPKDWPASIQFDSNIDGTWQSIPISVTEMIKDQGIDLILKFGMGLLRIPTDIGEIPIVSFHHGDPAHYRGRPAIFYEMLNKESYVGIVVQRLTNVLDSGTVLAFAEAQVVPYSYRGTTRNVYAISKYLLKQAIYSFTHNQTVAITPTKKLFRLPKNISVIKLSLKLWFRYAKKILDTAFYDRYWKIGVSSQDIDFFSANILSVRNSHVLGETKDYSFVADPFFCPRGQFLRFEGMSKRTGLGELAQLPISLKGDSDVVMRGPHLSYPMSYIEDDVEFLIPEMSALSKLERFTIENGCIIDSEILGEFDGMAIKDPTIYSYNGIRYCFFSEGHTANFVLHLWVDEAKMGKFKPHPASPICISPGNARMGGNIIFSDDNLFRLGQCCNTMYGEALSIMKIDTLSPNHFSESKIGSVVIDQGLGPHTLNFHESSGQITFDFFTFEFNLFAWTARINRIVRSYRTAGKNIEFESDGK